jgi:predicted DNA-binding transcriptional regulator AlpA
MPSRNLPPLIRRPAVARLLGVSLTTLQGMVRAGSLPPGVLVGTGRRRKHRLWRRSDIEAFAAGDRQVVPA